jgi:hypothetical protein
MLGRSRPRNEVPDSFAARAGSEYLAGAVIAELGHLRRRDSVGMQWWIFITPPTDRGCLDDPALPEWALAVEPPLHDAGDHREQFGVIARLGQRDAMEMMCNVKCGSSTHSGEPDRTGAYAHLRAA